MESPACSPKYVTWTGDARSSLAAQKVVLWNVSERPRGPRCFWELRTIVAGLNKQCASFSVNDFVKRQFREGVVSDGVAVGCEAVDFRPSLRSHAAASSASDKASREPFLLQGSFVSSQLLFVALCRWAFKLSEPSDAAAKLMLEDIVFKVAGRLGATHDMSVGCTPVARAPFKCGRHQGRVCSHTATVFSAHARQSKLLMAAVPEFLLDLYDGWKGSKCEGMRVYFKRCVGYLAAVLEQELRNSSRWATDPKGVVAPRGKAKRRRQDEHAIMDTPAKKVRRAGSLSAIAGFDRSEHQEAEAMKSFVCSYMEKVCELYAPVRQLSLCFDASRLSNEETLCFSVYSKQVGLAAWSLPQVLPANQTHTTLHIPKCPVTFLVPGEIGDSRFRHVSVTSLSVVREKVAISDRIRDCTFWLGKVLPDLKRIAPVLRSEVINYRIGWKRKIAEVLDGHKETDTPETSSLVKVKRQAVIERQASHNAVRALDHTLQFLGHGLNRFIPAEGVAPRVLKPFERRETIKHPGPFDDGLPQEIREAAVKFVVVDTQAQKKRYELAEYKAATGRPCLSIWTDRGPDMMASSFFITGHLGARVVWMHDRFHDKWNAVEKAIKGVNMWPLVQDLLHVVNLFQGPWVSKAWYKQFLETWSVWLEHGDTNNELWLALYDRIALDRGADRAILCDPKDIQRFMVSLSDSACCGRSSTKVSMRSWFSLFNRLDEFLPDWNLILFGLCFLQLEMGVVKKPSDLPIWGSGVARGHVGGGAPEPATLEDLRKECRNALHMGSVILGDTKKRHLAAMLLELVRPLWSGFVKMEEGMKGEKNIEQYFVGFATGKFYYVVRRVFNAFSDGAKLPSMGFSLDVEVGAGQGKPLKKPKVSELGKQSSIFTDKVSDAHRSELDLAEDMLALAHTLVKENALNELEYTHCLPGQLALLATNCQATTTRGLASLQRFWEVWEAAEARMHGDASVRWVLKSIPWMQNTTIREITIACAEFQFRYVPSSAKSIISMIFTSFGHEAVVENGFKVAKEAIRKAPSKQLSRLRGHCAIINGKVFDRYDRKSVEVQSNATQVCKRLPAAATSALGGRPSLPQEKIKEIAGKKVWNSFSAISVQDAAFSWALLSCAQQGNDWSVIGKAWRCLLFVEGSVVLRKADLQYFWVVASRARGLLLWALDKKDLDLGYETFALRGNMPEIVCTFSWDEWSAIPTIALPPTFLRNVCGCAQAPVEVAWAVDGPPMDILPFCAWRGFRGVPAWVMTQQLMQDLGVPREERPLSLLQAVEFLVRRVLVGISDDDLVDIMKNRVNLNREGVQASVLQGDQLDYADGVVDDSDKADMKRFKKKELIDAIVEKAATLEYLRGQRLLGSKDMELLTALTCDSVVKARSDKIAANTAKKRVTNWTPQAVREMAPKAAGCVMQRYGMHRRWQVYYPGAAPHYSRSRTWGGKVTEEAVVRHCLKWAWHWHTLKTGVSCPWDLDS